MNLEKLHRDTADAIKAVRALEGGHSIEIEASDDGKDWNPDYRYLASNDNLFKQFRYYRLPKPKQILWMETGWVKNKESGNFYAVLPWEYGLYKVLDGRYKYENMVHLFTPATLAEVQQAERDMRGEG